MDSDTQVEILPNEAEIIARINQLHTEAENFSRSAKDYAEQAISRAVECGRLLSIQKKITKYGEWKDWLSINCKFKKSTAYNYIALFKKVSTENGNIEEFHHSGILVSESSPKTLRQALIATGILPEPVKPESANSDDSTVSYITHIDKIVKWYKDLIELKELKYWSFAERKAVLNDLKPIVQIFNELSSKENV